MIEVRSAAVAFRDRTVLSELSFQAGAGEFVCVVGPSGCGKTTLLRVLAGLVPLTKGEALADGTPIGGPARERAIVFQDYTKALLPWRTVAGNVALSLEASGMAEPERSRRVEALLAKMGLSECARHYPSQLSGGMQQRVQIARALAQDPKLLLMDEPFGALDAITRQGLQDELGRLVAGQGTTVVFITHDLEEAIYLGDRVIVLGTNPGRIVEDIAVAIPRPRSQLETREDARFLEYRHRLFGLLKHQ